MLERWACSCTVRLGNYEMWWKRPHMSYYVMCVYHHFLLSQLYQKTMHKEIKTVTSSYFYFLPLNPKVSNVQKVMVNHTRTQRTSSFSSCKGSSKWKNFHINHHSLQLFPFDKTPKTCCFFFVASYHFFFSFAVSAFMNWVNWMHTCTSWSLGLGKFVYWVEIY